MNLIIVKLEDIVIVHRITSKYIDAQTKITYTTYAVLGTLFVFSSMVCIRSCWLKQKYRLLLMQLILLLGYAAGISGGYCLQEFYEIGSKRSILINRTDQEKLQKVYYGFVYSFGTFSIAINVAHWLFAMQYWSLTVKLESAIK
jgi:hypothetical protein